MSSPSRTPSVLARLGASFALLVALIMVTGVVGVAALASSLSATDRVLREVQPARHATVAVLLDMTEVQSGVRGYLLTGRRSFLDGARRGVAALEEDGAALRRAGRTAGVASPARQVLLRAERWLADHGRPALEAAGVPGGLDRIRRSRDNEAARASFEAFRAAAERLDETLAAESAALRQRGADVRRVALALLVATSVASVVLGSLAAVHTLRGLVRPLGRLRAQVDAMTTGASGLRVDENAGPLEVRAVGRAINALAAEGERLRSAERDQLQARRTAHDVGLRIRERIVEHEVLDIAVEEIGMAFGVDRVLLRRMHGGRLGPVVREWCELDVQPLGPERLSAVEQIGTAMQAEALWGDVKAVVGAVGDDGSLPTDSEVRDLLVACEAASCLVVAFGAGRQAEGTLTLLQRTRRIWTDGEVAAVESVAADLGRALHHAAIYDRERSLVEQLRELDRTKTDFLSTVSHELRTPLTSITGYIELLRDEADLDPASIRMLDVIERNSYRLNSLIEDLLTLSRIESGAARTQRVPVDVPALVCNACADVAPRAAEAGLCLRVVEGPAVRVQGDPGQLDRVLLNLLTNAVKFTPRGGSVTVSWHVADGEVSIGVTDTGIGIPEAEQGRLSTRFFRASNAMQAAIPGTGLGLTIVRGILDLHGGALDITSSQAGTRVTVRLPAARPEGLDSPEQGTRAPAARL